MTRDAVILILAIVFNASANVLIKIGMLKVGKTERGLELLQKAVVQPVLFGGILLFVLSLGAYSMVLTRLNLSIAYPIMVSVGLILVTCASYFLLNETIRPLQIVGFLLIVSGVWFVAR